MRIVVFSLSFLLNIYPLILLYSLEGIKGAFRFFAPDAFYYFAISEHSFKKQLFSFDGEFATNGFHPLWQLFTVGLRRLSNGDEFFILVVFWFCAVAISIASASISVFFYRISKRPLLSIAFSSPGAFGVLLAPIDFDFGSTWSFSNGMETSFSIALFALLTWVIVKSKFYDHPRYSNAILIAFLSLLLVFSRLDDVFLVASIVVLFAYRVIQVATHRKYMLTYVLLVGFGLSFYLLFNHLYSGLFFPVSGGLKSEFAITSNILKVANSIVPLHELLNGGGVYWTDLTWRVAFLLIPPLVVILFYFGNRKYGYCDDLDSNTRSLLFTLSLYVLLKSFYNAFFVPLWSQGNWYFPLSVIVCNLLLMMAASRFRYNQHNSNGDFVIQFNAAKRYVGIILVLVLFVFGITIQLLSGKKLLFAFFVGLGLLLSLISINDRDEKNGLTLVYGLFSLSIIMLANAFVMQKIRSDYNSHYFHFWNNSNRISSEIMNRFGNDVKIVSYDDGIVAFSLDFPILSGLGYALDKESAYYKSRGRLLDLAVERGYKFVASINYLGELKLNVGELVVFDHCPFWLTHYECNEYEFRLAYKDDSSGFQMLAISKK